MRPLVSLRRAFDDPKLLAPVMGGESREPMRALLLASQGEELTESELAHFQRLTGRETPPAERVEEGHIIAGRRSGKSSGVSSLAVYAAALCDYQDKLSPGERGVVLCVAENQKQAAVLLNYIEGALQASPALKQLIVNRTKTTLSLSNNIDIEVRAADFRGLRGPTLVMAICDEIAFWRSDDSTNPDEEIVAAIRPSLVTTGGQLFSIGSPYAKRGFQYSTFRQHYGSNGDPRILVAKGETRAFNPTISEDSIKRAIDRDPSAARSEWLGEFRSDIDAFVTREVVEACVVPDRFEVPRLSGVRHIAFVDPSGGSADDMTLAICHREGDKAILDCIRAAHPPFSPDGVVSDFAQTLKAYGVNRVTGDRYGGEWPREAFRKSGIQYDCSAKPKSDIYREALPLLNGGSVELLDHSKLVAQLVGLERRTSRGGRDSIDHAPGAHDDVANAVCGGLVLAVAGGAGMPPISDATMNAFRARPRAFY